MQVDKNCPYRCTEGKVFDVTEKHFVPCPHCSKIMSDIVKGVSTEVTDIDIYDLLKIPKRYISKEFNLEYLVKDFYAVEWASLSSVLEVMQNMLDLAHTTSTLPYSVVFELGLNADILNFAYNYLQVALVHGLSVCPIVSPSDIFALRCDMEGDETFATTQVRNALGVSYHDLTTKDVCIVSADSGSTKYAPKIILGLLQARERNGLSTIVFARDARLTSGYSTEKSLHTMYPYKLKYILPKDTSFMFSYSDYTKLLIKLLNDGVYCVDAYLDGDKACKETFAGMIKSIEHNRLKMSDIQASRYSLFHLGELCDEMVAKLAIYARYRVNVPDEINRSRFIAYQQEVSRLCDMIKLEVDRYCSSASDTKSSEQTVAHKKNKGVSEDISSSVMHTSVPANSILEMKNLGKKGSL